MPADLESALIFFKGLNLGAIFITLIITQQVKPLFANRNVRKQMPFLLGLCLGAVVEKWSPYQFDPFILVMRMWAYGGAAVFFYNTRKPVFTVLRIYRPDEDDPTNGGAVPPPKTGGTP